MKLDQETIEWIEEKISELNLGEISIVIHIRDGSVKWIEKVSRETEKVEGD